MAGKSDPILAFGDQFEPNVFWEKHGRKIVLGISLVLAAVFAVFYMQRQKLQAAQEASEELARASDVASLQQIISRYPGKEPAAQALLQLASLHYQGGKYTEAVASYQDFVQQFPRHEMLQSALLGAAASLEAQGDVQGAKTRYEDLLRSFPDGYVAMDAKLGLARCLEAAGQLKEARQVYEEIVGRGFLAPSSVQMTARTRLVVLERQLPPEEPAPQPVTPTTGTPPAVSLPQ